MGTSEVEGSLLGSFEEYDGPLETLGTAVTLGDSDGMLLGSVVAEGLSEGRAVGQIEAEGFSDGSNDLLGNMDVLGDNEGEELLEGCVGNRMRVSARNQSSELKK